jgi:hypothetical protein
VPYKKGFNRVSWDLTRDLKSNIISGSSRLYSPSIRVSPGKYSFNVYTEFNGEVNKIGSKFFEVERIRTGVLNNPNLDQIEAFIVDLENTYKNYSDVNHKFSKIKKSNKSIPSLISKTSNYKSYVENYNQIKEMINMIDVFVSGNKSKKDIREKDIETISDRLSVAISGVNSSYGPTSMQISSLNKAKSLITDFNNMLKELSLEFYKLKNQLEGELESQILD